MPTRRIHPIVRVRLDLNQRRNYMNKNYKTVKIMLIPIFAILFSGIYASADRGRSCGHHGGMHQCQGWHHRGHGGPGGGDLENLGKDEIKKLDEERTAFFEATKGLRRKIYQKRLELRIRMPLSLPVYKRKYPILRPKWPSSVWSTYCESEKSTLISAAGFGTAVLWGPK